MTTRATQRRAGTVPAALSALTLFCGSTMAQDTTARTPAHTNRLANETSPYLLQHAHNPVEWYPWGEEAFEAARERGVPIFLSIGYSTCYWCHVMERESFENERIASIMNEHFVNIKVDREERPDVDEIYMACTQMLTGSGGWPMSVWLTPPGAQGPDDSGLKPFFAGTYFPAESKYGRTSFPQLLENIASAWESERQQVIEQADRIAGALREHFRAEASPAPVGAEQVGQAVSRLLRIHDREHGGFGGAPKFPQPVYLELLIESVEHIDDPAIRDSAKQALRLTLDKMALGGMYDQVGGGFHRYSTDEKWLVPHFEKMLYDNGQLVSVYAESHALWGDRFDARVVRDTLEYVLREMTSEDGAFHSAQDAEVDGREGLNYLWTREQLDEVLGEEDAGFAAKIYGVDQGENFRDPHHPEDGPKNVLFMVDRPETLAAELGMSLEEFTERERLIDERLYQARQQREQPGLDDKIIASWNGLMIRGFADGAAALGERRYLQASVRAARFALERMRGEEGALVRTVRSGKRGSEGFLEDYAMMASGLLATERAAKSLGVESPGLLDDAIRLLEMAKERFGDPETPGLYYDTLADQTDLIVRTRSAYDGALPSGNSVLLHAFIDAHELTGEKRYLDDALAQLGALSRAIREQPVGPCEATRALYRLLAIAPDRVAAIGEGAEVGADVREPASPVQVFAPGERITVPDQAGESVTFPVRLAIEEGYHIIANPPGVEGLVPTSVGVEGGSGVGIEVGYPEGDPLRIESLPEDTGTPRVYEGEVELVVTLTRSEGEWSGRPLLVVEYQACDDRACLAPQKVELDIAIDRGE